MIINTKYGNFDTKDAKLNPRNDFDCFLVCSPTLYNNRHVLLKVDTSRPNNIRMGVFQPAGNPDDESLVSEDLDLNLSEAERDELVNVPINICKAITKAEAKGESVDQYFACPFDYIPEEELEGL